VHARLIVVSVLRFNLRCIQRCEVIGMLRLRLASCKGHRDSEHYITCIDVDKVMKLRSVSTNRALASWSCNGATR